MITTNIAYSKHIIDFINQQYNCAQWCVCPGGRNSPIVIALDSQKTLSFFDEQSAAFFAIGQIKRDQRPVAVTTTSGTAVAQLLPAIIEAFYTQLPLIVITADRPRSFRNTGAPQTINQVHIFGQYAQCIDLAVPEPLPTLSWDQKSPFHLNICFDAPLLE
jgi:2-succinyl-5-enolpyruvyl-6-hydroxy-3-cyclohexene-1-carboxylate synthase